jgi:hypothetical protein
MLRELDHCLLGWATAAENRLSFQRTQSAYVVCNEFVGMFTSLLHAPGPLKQG